MKRRNFWFEALLLSLPLLVLLSFWIPEPIKQKVAQATQPWKEQKRLSCQSSLKQIALAIAQYSQDADGKYPLSTGFQASLPVRYGWAEAIQPDFKCVNCFQCGSDSHSIDWDYWKLGFTDFWLNGHVSGRAKSEIKQPSLTLLLGDGNDGTQRTDANYNITNFPSDWLIDSTKPPYRHFGGANYTFADGHTKWLHPREIEHIGGRVNPFALK